MIGVLAGTLRHVSVCQTLHRFYVQCLWRRSISVAPQCYFPYWTCDVLASCEKKREESLTRATRSVEEIDCRNPKGRLCGCMYVWTYGCVCFGTEYTNSQALKWSELLRLIR